MAYKNKTYQKEYQRNWVRKRRQTYFKNKVCANCGSTVRLELDHINPKMKITNRIWSWSKIRQQRELNKCQVLCQQCHKDKHTAKHGSFSRYARHKCRCKKCVTFYSKKRKSWKSRNKDARKIEYGNKNHKTICTTEGGGYTRLH